MGRWSLSRREFVRTGLLGATGGAWIGTLGDAIAGGGGGAAAAAAADPVKGPVIFWSRETFNNGARQPLLQGARGGVRQAESRGRPSSCQALLPWPPASGRLHELCSNANAATREPRRRYDTHRRHIEAEVDGLAVSCLYLPNNGNPAPGLTYKLLVPRLLSHKSARGAATWYYVLSGFDTPSTTSVSPSTTKATGRNGLARPTR